jgi:hypothetical protein
MPKGIYTRTVDMMTGKHHNHNPWNKGMNGIVSTKKGKKYPHLQDEKSISWICTSCHRQYDFAKKNSETQF